MVLTSWCLHPQQIFLSLQQGRIKTFVTITSLNIQFIRCLLNADHHCKRHWDNNLPALLSSYAFCVCLQVYWDDLSSQTRLAQHYPWGLFCKGSRRKVYDIKCFILMSNTLFKSVYISHFLHSFITSSHSLSFSFCCPIKNYKLFNCCRHLIIRAFNFSDVMKTELFFKLAAAEQISKQYLQMQQ